MNAERPDRPPENPLAQLERAFIDEFLKLRGHSVTSLRELPEAEAHAIMREASLYASGKLTEVESRAHYVDEMHHAPTDSTRKGPS